MSKSGGSLGRMFVVAVLSVAPSLVSASNWRGIGPGLSASTPAGKRMVADEEIDLDSIAPSGKYVKAWLRETYGKDVVHPTIKKQFRVESDLWYYNCSDRTAVLMALTLFNSHNEVVFNWSDLTDYTGESPVGPDSVGEYALDRVCKAAKARAKQ